LKGINRWTSYFAFTLGITQLVFVINLVKSLLAGKKASNNPWEVTTLEWTHATSPPVFHNYDVIPTVVRGSHEYANPVVKKLLGRDYLDQTEPMPEASQVAEAEAAE
jgi:cytochrome c oxidase subunit 1